MTGWIWFCFMMIFVLFGVSEANEDWKGNSDFVLELKGIPEFTYNRIHGLSSIQSKQLSFLHWDKDLLTEIESYSHTFKLSSQWVSQVLDIAIDKNASKQDTLLEKLESWVKNGIFFLISNHITCRSSIHSLSSLLGLGNLMIISDKVEWNQDQWSIPEFFAVSVSYGYKRENNNIAVYDTSQSCQSHEWHDLAKIVLKETICPSLEHKNLMWVPSGWTNSFAEWDPINLPPSDERFNFFYVPFKNLNLILFQRLVKEINVSKFMEKARGRIQMPGEDTESWREHLTLRDSAFTICSPLNFQNPCLYQALFHGSIPILVLPKGEKKNMQRFLGFLPFPVIHDIKELPLLLEYALHHLDEVNQMQKNTIQWWDKKLLDIQQEVTTRWLNE